MGRKTLKIKQSPIKRKCKIKYYIERKLIYVDIKTDLTMLKGCALTATTETGELRNLGVVITRNFMLLVCARIATSTITTEKGEKSLVNSRERKRNSQV